MKYIAIILILFSLSCKKNKEMITNSFLAGKLLYLDINDPSGKNIKASNKLIRLNKSLKDSNNYISITKTDIDGNFVFASLLKDQKYLLYYRDTINGVIFTSYNEVTVGNDSLKIIGSPDLSLQNALTITVKEGNNMVRKPEICIYTNKLDRDSGDCSKAIRHVIIDTGSAITLYNFLPGKYYLKVSAIIGGKTYEDVKDITLEPKGPQSISADLIPKNLTGFQLYIVDIFGTPVNAASSCVFVNYTSYISDSCSGSIKTLSTDIYGKTPITELQQGIYYINSYKNIGNITIKSKDAVSVTTNQIKTDTITLK